VTSDNARAGSAAEDFVARWLLERGYELVGRNLRFGHYELDIVVRDGPLIIVVEVRARSVSSFTSPLSSLDGKKRERTRRAGERLWNRRFRDDPSAERLRFDVASVTFGDDGPELEYVPAAF
jgi:putative endonuclease